MTKTTETFTVMPPSQTRVHFLWYQKLSFTAEYKSPSRIQRIMTKD